MEVTVTFRTNKSFEMENKESNISGMHICVQIVKLKFTHSSCTYTPLLTHLFPLPKEEKKVPTQPEKDKSHSSQCFVSVSSPSQPSFSHLLYPCQNTTADTQQNSGQSHHFC